LAGQRDDPDDENGGDNEYLLHHAEPLLSPSASIWLDVKGRALPKSLMGRKCKGEI
jgi:hypothetical protein